MNSKKIIFVGVFTDPNSTNISQSRGFTQIGYEVINYDYRNRLVVLGNTIKRDNELINLVINENPEFIIISKGSGINYYVIDECNKYTKTCLWYMDASHNYNSELIEKVKRSTICICGVEEVRTMMLSENKNSYFVHQCPDEKLNFKIKNCQKIYDTMFIGSMSSSMHKDRKKYLDDVKFNYKNGVYGEEHNLIVNQTKINLSFAPIDGSGVSVRLYKLMASGGFVLTTPWNGIEKTFTIGKHLDVFNNSEELKEKIKFYLDNEQLRETISNNGHTLVEKNFLPNSWASKISELIKTI